jgi:hypothetical protein
MHDLGTWRHLRAGGRKIVLYGGEGYMLDDAGEGPAPCVYVLDVDSLTWHKQVTHAPVESHSPGVRSLHVTTVRVSSSLPTQPAHPCLLRRSLLLALYQHDLTPGLAPLLSHHALHSVGARFLSLLSPASPAPSIGGMGVLDPLQKP